MDELYKQRQDFTVYTTLADLDRPYAKRVKISDRDEYLDFIRSMQVGVGFKNILLGLYQLQVLLVWVFLTFYQINYAILKWLVVTIHYCTMVKMNSYKR